MLFVNAIFQYDAMYPEREHPEKQSLRLKLNIVQVMCPFDKGGFVHALRWMNLYLLNRLQIFSKMLIWLNYQRRNDCGVTGHRTNMSYSMVSTASIPRANNGECKYQ